MLTHFQQVVQPSGIEYSLILNLINNNNFNLITTKTNSLKIYDLIQSDVYVKSFNNSNDSSNNDNDQQYIQSPNIKLILRREYEFHGEIIGIQKLKTLSSYEDGKDRLLVAFRDAKLALLEWSDELNDIITVSIHTYERSNTVSSNDMSRFKGRLNADPQDRCAALLLPDDSLAILPIHSAYADLDDLNEELSNAIRDVPYSPSFVLQLKQVESDIRNVIDFCFLPGFHNPTLAVLCQPRQTWTGRLSDAQDTCQIYFVTLDLVTQVYPIIATVENLPYDCMSMKPAPMEIGGVAVLSANAIIHVDQNGRAVGRATNGWAALTSSRINDPPPKGLFIRLEGAEIEFIDNHKSKQSYLSSLLFLPNGDIHVIRFIREGRSVSRLDISPSFARGTIPSGVHKLNLNKEDNGGQFLFISSMVGVSFFLRVGNSINELQLFEDEIQLNGINDNTYNDMDMDVDEELYGKSDSNLKDQSKNDEVENNNNLEPPLRICDHINSHGPIQDITIGTYNKQHHAPLQILAATGSGHVGGITSFHQDIPFENKIKLDISGNKGLWSFHLKNLQNEQNYDNFIIASDSKPCTTIYKLESSGELLKVSENSEISINVGSISNSSRILQITRKNIKIFELNGNQRDVVNVKETEITQGFICDPYILIFQANGIVSLYVEKEGIVEKVSDLSDNYVKGSIFIDRFGFLNSKPFSCFLGMLTHNGEFEIIEIETMNKLWINKMLREIPTILTSENENENEEVSFENNENLINVVDARLVDFGNIISRPHLIILYENGQLIIYDGFKLNHDSQLSFSKVTTTTIQLSATMASNIIPINDNAIFITGRTPIWINCGNKSIPRIHPFSQKYIHHATSYINNDTFGIVYYVNDEVILAKINSEVELDETVPIRRLASGRHYDKVTFDPTTEMYVATSTSNVPFRLFDHTGNYVWKPPAENLSPATSYRSAVELLSSDLKSAIFGYELEQNEFVISCEVVSLLSPSRNSGTKDFIGVGTCISRGEDVAVKGAMYLFEIVELIPSSKDVGNNYKLKLCCREETRGAVSAITSCSGYFVVAVGQKVLIRALEDNERLISVAFYDAGTYIVSLEVLKNFILVGDQVKSVTFLAFQESPYKLVQLSRDPRQIETTVANFLAHEDQITFVSNDIKGDLRLIDYNPLDPVSEGGEKLIRTTEFHKGSEATCTLLLAKPSVRPSSQLLIGHTNGSISCLLPLDENIYKPLQLLQGALIRQIPHHAALNPRAHRFVRNDYVSRSLSKGVLDGLLLVAFEMLSSKSQFEIAKRIGHTKPELLDALRLCNWSL